MSKGRLKMECTYSKTLFYEIFFTEIEKKVQI